MSETTATNHDELMATLEKYSDISLKMIALLTGVILFFPSVFGFVQPPYKWDFLLFLFWTFSFLSIASHVLSFYFSQYAKQVPERSAGVGNISAVLAIFSFSLFLFINVIEDKKSKPTIISIESSSYSPSMGDVIDLSAEVIDQDNDKLTWGWEAEWIDAKNSQKKEVLGSRKNASWKVPTDISGDRLYIILKVKDDNKHHVTDTLKIYLKKSSMSEVSNFINSKIQEKIIYLQNQGKSSEATSLYELKGVLLEMATDNIKTIDEAIQNEKVIVGAIDLYVRDFLLLKKIKDPRPCCSKYPAIWPLCKRSC
jgi:hypothetical protein